MLQRELRIGNWVSFNGKHISLSGIGIRDIWIELEIGGVAENEWKPIEITEQWLSNMGFSGNDGYYNKSNLNYSIYDKKWFFMGLMMLDIKYVHQLQNFYFAVHGNELTIVNK